MADPATSPLHPGHVIVGRYRLDEPVGSGAMATVWSGTDLILHRRVAIKVLHSHLRSDPAFLARFRHEAKVAARVTHHGVVSVYDTVEDQSAEAIVLEFVDGITLREHLDRVRRLSPSDTIELGVDLCDALEAAHRSGLVHRDIKPANILIAFDGTVKIADFGIAKAEGDGDLTQMGTVVGTASYLAPEQLRGEAVDRRTDLFSVGVVLYEALCGVQPFAGDTDTARAVARLHQDPAPPTRFVAGISPALESAIMSSLERDPDSRPIDAADLGHRLADARRSPAQTQVPDDPAPVVPRERTAERPAIRRSRATSSRASRRRRPRVSTITLTALIGGALLLLVVLFATTQGRSPIRSTARSTTTLSAVALDRADAIAYDPGGTGQPGENNATILNLIDGDPGTVWRTETYQRRDFGTKPGVGVEITPPSQNWSASLYVLPSAAAPDQLPPRPTSVIANASGNATLAGGSTIGRAVLVWITDLGDGPGPYRFESSEIEVHGRT
jgi:serine/threonine protein kinase